MFALRFPDTPNRLMRRLLELPCAIVTLSLPLLAQGVPPVLPGEILFVDAQAPPGGSGFSWAEALADLRVALALAADQPIREIWVAEGTYTPAGPGGPRKATFRVPRQVEVYGGFGGFETRLDERDPAVHPTILSGDLNGDDGPGFANRADNVLHVVTLVASKARLDGLTVRGGNADVPGRYTAAGGGVFVYKGAPTLVSVILEDNVAQNFALPRGGGLFAERATITLRSCIARDNASRGAGQAAGAGLYFQLCQALVEDGLFVRNDADGQGGGLGAAGGSLTVRGSTFRANHARDGAGMNSDLPDALVVEDSVFNGGTSTQGGGLRLESARNTARVRVEGCSFTGNQATDGAGMALNHDDPVSVVSALLRSCSFRNGNATSGGGFSTFGGILLTVEDCLFDGNQVTTGGGFSLFGGSAEVVRCTFRNNSLKTGAGLGSGGCGLYAGVGSSLVTVEDSVFFRNQKEEIWAEGDLVRVEGSTLVHDSNVYPALRATLAGRIELSSTILWGGNTARAGSVQAAYCNVRGGIAGVGNLDADPMFVSANGGNPQLQPGSPCIDAGDPAFLPPGEDAFGDPRLLDGDLDGVLAVDIGADEFDPVGLAVADQGDRLAVTTSGGTGTAALLLVGLEPASLFVPGLGYVGVQALSAEPWDPAPGTTTIAKPAALLGLTVRFQSVVSFGPASVLSNLVELAL